MLTDFPVNIGLAPNSEQGARITSPVMFTSNFVANGAPFGSVQTLDMVMEDANGTINNIQTMYVDASLSRSDFQLTFQGGSQQSTWIRALTQGYYQIACGSNVRVTAAAFVPGGTNADSVSVQFLNVPVAPYVWSTRSTIKGFTLQSSNLTGAALTLSSNGGIALPAGFQQLITGFGWDIAGATGDVNTRSIISTSGLVGGFGPNSIPKYSVLIDAAGGASYQFTFPQPMCLGNGGANAFTLTTPALTSTAVTLNQLSVYFEII